MPADFALDPSPPSRQPRERLDRGDAIALATLIAATLLVGTVVVRAPLVLGIWVDDGVYLATAKSLAEGKGYRHAELPGEPYQAKYPILYPFLLSLIWRVVPDFPANITAIKLVNVFFVSGGAWIAFRLMRRLWGTPAWLAGSGALIGVISPGMLGVAQSSMSEPLYWLLSMAALATPQRGDAPAGGATIRSLPRALLAGLLASGAYLTRSIGVTVIVALLADLLLRRRWRELFVVASLAGTTVGGWSVWKFWAEDENSKNPSAAAFRYDLDYRAWVPRDVSTLGWVAWQNSSALALETFSHLVTVRDAWVTDWIRGGLGRGAPLYVALTAVTVFTAIGFAVTFRRAAWVLHLYLVAYLGVVLAWPMSPSRFIVPLIALLASLLMAGVYATIVGVAGWLDPAPRRAGTRDLWHSDRPAAGIAFPATAVLAVVMLYTHLTVIISQPDRGSLAKMQAERAALGEALRARTPADSVICAGDGGYLHVTTGRKFVLFMPYDDPIPFRYSADRKFRECGRLMSDGEFRAERDFVRAGLLDYLRKTGATHIIPPPIGSAARDAFELVRRDHPNLLSPIAATEFYSLFELRIGP